MEVLKKYVCQIEEVLLLAIKPCYHSLLPTHHTPYFRLGGWLRPQRPLMRCCTRQTLR